MTKNKRAAYAVTILILLAILIAITAVLSVMSKRLNKLTAEKDYLIIGIEDPVTGDPVYDDFSLTLSCDDATDFSLVKKRLPRGIRRTGVFRYIRGRFFLFAEKSEHVRNFGNGRRLARVRRIGSRI